MQFTPPPFNPIRQFPDIGATLDSVFNQAIQQKLLERQQATQDLQTNLQLAPMGITLNQARQNPNLFDNAQNPNLLPNQPYNPLAGPQSVAPGTGPQAMRSPLEQRLADFLERQRTMAALGMRKEVAETGVAESEARLKGAIADNIQGQGGGNPQTVRVAGVDYIPTINPTTGQREFKEVPNRAVGVEKDLREELTKNSHPFMDLKSAYEKVLSSGADQDPASRAQNDMSLLFGFIRMQHPDALVREGQIANVEQARSVGDDALVGLYNKAVNGQPLSPDQRNGIIKASKRLYDSQVQGQHQLEGSMAEIAKRNGANPENVLLPSDLTDQAKKAASSLGLDNPLASNPKALQIRAALKAGQISYQQARTQLQAISGGR